MLHGWGPSGRTLALCCPILLTLALGRASAASAPCPAGCWTPHSITVCMVVTLVTCKAASGQVRSVCYFLNPKLYQKSFPSLQCYSLSVN